MSETVHALGGVQRKNSSVKMTLSHSGEYRGTVPGVQCHGWYGVLVDHRASCNHYSGHSHCRLEVEGVRYFFSCKLAAQLGVHGHPPNTKIMLV